MIKKMSATGLYCLAGIYLISLVLVPVITYDAAIEQIIDEQTLKTIVH